MCKFNESSYTPHPTPSVARHQPCVQIQLLSLHTPPHPTPAPCSKSVWNTSPRYQRTSENDHQPPFKPARTKASPPTSIGDLPPDVVGTGCMASTRRHHKNWIMYSRIIPLSNKLMNQTSGSPFRIRWLDNNHPIDWSYCKTVNLFGLFFFAQENRPGHGPIQKYSTN